MGGRKFGMEIRHNKRALGVINQNLGTHSCLFVVTQRELSETNGGFTVTESNAFGNTFRDYSADTARKEIVKRLYRQSHINQTYDFVKQMREKYGKVDRVEMRIWECCELLNEVVDDSDPDLDESQIEHLLQTAEAIRKYYPDEDWLQLLV